jgi:3-isopropylmalate dehydratase large subunit
MSAKTLYDKLWDSHVVRQEADGTVLLYIDRHLVHEVTSPQAFEGLKLAHRNLWRTASILAVADHNVPTTNGAAGIADPVSRLQVDTLDANCAEFIVTEFKMGDIRQGVVHVMGPEQGATLPGMTVVCGDSHTSTHGAFAALAFGIGTSEVEHVMATQCLLMKKTKAMQVVVDGKLGRGVTAKDIALAVTPLPNAPSTTTCMALVFFINKHCVAITCSTSDVPIPNASAANAPCVLVCESPHTTVMPGKVAPCSGPITCTIPWRTSDILNSFTPNSAQLLSSVSTCKRETGSAIPCARPVVGTL